MAHELTQMKTSLETTDDGNEDNIQQPQIYAKDSLDRFGDDLFEVLLSYLSLEDRFRCECVSKQIQRTVFASVVDINIDDKLMSRAQNRSETLNYLFGLIARKCSNIETIDCQGITTCLEHFPHMSAISRDNFRLNILALNERKYEILTIFRNNCRHLQEIYCNLMPNNNHFFDIFGPLITRIDSGRNYSEKKSLIHCHRLSQLTVVSLSDVFDYTSRLLAKNLQTFSFAFNQTDYEKDLSAFVAQNQSLKRLDVYVMGSQTHESMAELCGQLSQLPQLRELRLDFVHMYYQNLINDSLRTIGVNCKQLQRLSLRLSAESKEIIDQSLDLLRFYSQLKRLDLTLNAAIDGESLEPLKLCHRLTHLTLDMNTRKMSERFLHNCDQYLPRLQFLHICHNYNKVKAECLSHISRLPALQTLVIESWKRNKLSDNDLCHLLSTSPKLKNIEVIENKLNAIKFHNDLHVNKLVFT